MDQDEVEKLEQAAEVHGYRGNSKAKHNGIVTIRPTDAYLLKALDIYSAREKKFLETATRQEDRKMDEKSTQLLPVKLVAHCPSGNRAVGLLYLEDNEPIILLVLGFGNYQKMLKYH